MFGWAHSIKTTSTTIYWSYWYIDHFFTCWHNIQKILRTSVVGSSWWGKRRKEPMTSSQCRLMMCWSIFLVLIADNILICGVLISLWFLVIKPDISWSGVLLYPRTSSTRILRISWSISSYYSWCGMQYFKDLLLTLF